MKIVKKGLPGGEILSKNPGNFLGFRIKILKPTK